MSDIARRSLLAGISAGPAAMVAAALPSAALAHPAALVGNADADLIAQAAQVTRLSRLSDRAQARAGRKSDAVMQTRGPQPVVPCAWGGSAEVEDLPTDPASDIERTFITRLRRPSADHQEARHRHATALAAWNAEGDRLNRETGTPAAAMLCGALFDRLQDATDMLIAMPATSSAGMAAKAGAFLALMETRQEAEGWQLALARSLARDAARIGGRANV